MLEQGFSNSALPSGNESVPSNPFSLLQKLTATRKCSVITVLFSTLEYFQSFTAYLANNFIICKKAGPSKTTNKVGNANTNGKSIFMGAFIAISSILWRRLF